MNLLCTASDLDPLIRKTDDARYVLLGEASHGTHEYYTWRAAISKRLIQEQDFSFIAVEGDWPDCYQINRYVKGYAHAATSIDVLKKIKRWPTWMWSNWEIAALMDWLRDYNKNRAPDKKVGFYGLDVYSLWESMDAIVSYLRREDPAAAKLAIEAIRCFEPYGEEGHNYARAMLTLSADCTEEVVKLLETIRKHSRNYDHDPEASLNAEMNAQVIANAEKYYRAMVSFRDESWNIRDVHMFQTLEALMRFHGKNAKGIVWEHNTHVGDARYTDMKNSGTINVGQLVRESHPKKNEVFIVGFASYQGSVIAGRSWGAGIERMTVPPAIPGSIEHDLHNEAPVNRILLLDENDWKERFRGFRGHRAIGVVYHPERERGNYVPTILPSRYDAIVYIDQSKALHPLYLTPDGTEVPDTYPFGF